MALKRGRTVKRAEEKKVQLEMRAYMFIRSRMQFFI